MWIHYMIKITPEVSHPHWPKCSYTAEKKLCKHLFSRVIRQEKAGSCTSTQPVTSLALTEFKLNTKNHLPYWSGEIPAPSSDIPAQHGLPIQDNETKSGPQKNCGYIKHMCTQNKRIKSMTEAPLLANENANKKSNSINTRVTVPCHRAQTETNLYRQNITVPGSWKMVTLGENHPGESYKLYTDL